MIKRVYIEITNQCNLRCSFCDFHDRQTRELSILEFERILKQIKPYTSFIYLHVQGEPFCHSQFDQLLTLCDQHEMKVQLVTNGFLLPKELNHPSIRKVSISIHSIDEQKTDPDVYIQRIMDFIDLNHSKFYIDLRFWLQDQLKEKSLYCMEQLKKHYSFELTKKKDSYRIFDNTFVSFASSFEWPNEANNESVHGTCKGAKSMLAILSNGQVTICCLDAHGHINLGNILESDLDEILNSDAYQSIIKGFNENKCIMALCQKCTYRNRFQ